MTRFLFDHLDALADRIKAAPALAVFLDFDGTLVPFKDRPEMVQMPNTLKRCLTDLAGRQNVLLAMVSGRQRTDLQTRIGIPGLVYAGNHGLEISGPGFIFIEPSAVAYRDTLKEFAAIVADRIKEVDKAWVEDKGLTLAIHWRQADPSRLEELRRCVHGVLENASHPFVLTSGDGVYEIRPRVEWDKGAAIAWILEQAGKTNALALYLGDDKTDEDAFAALKNGITIKVGDPSETAAGYYVNNPEEVAKFLGWLCEIIR